MSHLDFREGLNTELSQDLLIHHENTRGFIELGDRLSHSVAEQLSSINPALETLRSITNPSTPTTELRAIYKASTPNEKQALINRTKPSKNNANHRQCCTHAHPPCYPHTRGSSLLSHQLYSLHQSSRPPHRNDHRLSRWFRRWSGYFDVYGEGIGGLEEFEVGIGKHSGGVG